jgi:hypothetical protein
MKTVLIITVILFIGFTLFQAYTVMASNKSGSQPYTVVRTEKDFEIRFYPATTMAIITSSAKTYKELGNSGFKKLAGYIFGGNQTNEKIAMTTPVHMDINQTLSTMSFVMPSQYNKDNLPEPNDSNVKIKTISQEYVAVMKFGGYASENDIKTNSRKLENALKEASISYYGHFRFLGYNPPFQFIGRRNEIIVSVDWTNK